MFFRILNRADFVPGPWYMGDKLSLFIHGVSCCWVMLICVIFVLPNTYPVSMLLNSAWLGLVGRKGGRGFPSAQHLFSGFGFSLPSVFLSFCCRPLPSVHQAHATAAAGVAPAAAAAAHAALRLLFLLLVCSVTLTRALQ